MNQRNWLDLSRKLVDRFDLNYTVTSMQEAIANAAQSFFGEGVLVSTVYPNPFVITLSNSVLGGSVGNGIAYDANGQLTSITSASSTSKSFVSPTADLFNTRYDLLCLQYVQSGDTLVPKPSDPITTIHLNLHDDFELVIVPGTPSGSPVYPSKGALQIILAGIQVPANSTLGTQCTVDLSIREQSFQGTAFYPVFAQERPSGLINGSNTVFALSQSAINNTSVLVRIDGVVQTQSVDYTISGQNITMAVAPALGQSIEVYYIVNSSSSQNPLSGYQEVPSGAIDGANLIFSLAGHPANQISTMVFIDGLASSITEWDLVQSQGTSQIVFGAGNQPSAGQSVYVFYLVNPASVIIQTGGGGGGGGGGAFTVQGTIVSPALIAAASGVHPTSDQRQYWFVKSTGGSVPITATPQIQPGTIIGQELYLRGVSATDFITLANGNGLSLNGTIELTDNGAIVLVWDGSYWNESARR